MARLAPRFSLCFSSLALFLAVTCAPLAGQAQSPGGAVSGFDTTAPFALLIDAETGDVLFERNPDEQMPPSSMGKMMTAYVVFDMIKRGEVKPTDTVTVSPETWRAWNNQGSTMFLKVGQQVSIADLLHGIVTVSGNDACVVLAEGLAGTEQAFVDRMNATARRLGMTGSHFANTTGWPDEQEYVTPRDLATLARHTILNFPDLYKEFYGLPSFTFGETMGGQPITQPNRNPLLGAVSGADGLKTGHTEAAGYGFTGSAKQGDRRLIMVVNGLTSMAERREQSIRLLTWGFRAFARKQVAAAGATLTSLPVHYGTQNMVRVGAQKTVAVTALRGSLNQLEARVEAVTPIAAPIKAGDKVADLVLTGAGGSKRVVPLVALEAVPQAGFGQRVKLGWQRLLTGALAAAPVPALASQPTTQPLSH